MMAGWVLRPFPAGSQTLLALRKGLMQPLLDYCKQLWMLHRRGDIQLLGAGQRSFTR